MPAKSSSAVTQGFATADEFVATNTTFMLAVLREYKQGLEKISQHYRNDAERERKVTEQIAEVFSRELDAQGGKVTYKASKTHIDGAVVEEYNAKEAEVLKNAEAVRDARIKIAETIEGFGAKVAEVESLLANAESPMKPADKLKTVAGKIKALQKDFAELGKSFQMDPAFYQRYNTLSGDCGFSAFVHRANIKGSTVQALNTAVEAFDQSLTAWTDTVAIDKAVWKELRPQVQALEGSRAEDAAHRFQWYEEGMDIRLKTLGWKNTNNVADAYDYGNQIGKIYPNEKDPSAHPNAHPSNLVQLRRSQFSPMTDAHSISDGSALTFTATPEYAQLAPMFGERWKSLQQIAENVTGQAAQVG